MLWQGRRESDNVEDRRGGGGMVIGGSIGAIVIGIIYVLLGGNPSDVVNQLATQPQTQESAQRPDKENKLAAFSKVVLADTEDVWTEIFKEQAQTYAAPRLVLFTNQTSSGCGFSSAATGPFYCPADEKIYLDLSFFEELTNRFQAPGEFAMAYVIAHEVGHHIQKLMGTAEKVESARQTLGKTAFNKLSVKLELQADFYAGVWANRAQRMKNILEEGDLESALNAANAIGDDRLQRESSGRVMPDAFTHGSSAQRMYWFKKGFETGDISRGNTFDSNE